MEKRSAVNDRHAKGSDPMPIGGPGRGKPGLQVGARIREIAGHIHGCRVAHLPPVPDRQIRLRRQPRRTDLLASGRCGSIVMPEAIHAPSRTYSAVGFAGAAKTSQASAASGCDAKSAASSVRFARGPDSAGNDRG